MAFRATNILPERGYERAKQTATGLRRFCNNLSSELAAGGNSKQILGVVDSLVSFKDNLNDVKSIPGMAAYAQEQENDGAYDVIAEFTALLSLIDAAILEVVNTFPTNGSGFLLAETINPNGTREPRIFTGAQLSGIRTVLDAVAVGVV